MEVFDKASKQETTEATEAPAPTASKHRSSLRVWREDHDQLVEVLEQFEGKTQQDKVAKWIRWTLQQLQKTPAPIEPVKAIEPEPQIEELQEEVEAVQPEPVQSETLPAPAPALETKIDTLVNAIAQLVQLQTQALTTATPAATPAPATRRRATTPTPAPANAEDQPERKYKPRGQNQELVDKAIDAIMNHNDGAQRHDEKWAITINGLKAWVGSQHAIKKGLDARAEEINQHHAKHQIDERKHNLRHRGKAAIDEIITLD